MRIIKKLPDPFLMNNGQRVKNQQDWTNRREEIKKLILDIQYGTMPGPPEEVQIKIKEKKELSIQKIEFTFIPNKNRSDISFNMKVSIQYPSPKIIEETTKKVKNYNKNGLPTIIYLGSGNPMPEMLEQGYVVIIYNNSRIERMRIGKDPKGPARKAYEELEPKKYTWGSIAVWAWGAIQLVNYLISNPKFDPNQIIISGHSRNGKAALLAGALDERIALINPVGSGCAGTGSYLVLGEGCEDLASFTDQRRWWAWTEKNFKNYAYEEQGDSKEKLPFDQHFVMGLVAPRPLLRTEGDLDTWANPEGTYCSYIATEQIYEFLDVSNRNQLFFHKGEHMHSKEDVAALRSFADWYFFDIPQERIFKDSVLKEFDFNQVFDWKKP